MFLLGSLLHVQSWKLSFLQTTSKALFHRRGGAISSPEFGKDSPSISMMDREPNIEYPMDHNSISKEYGMIFMDQFCPYHSVYLARRAREVYGISTISCLSTYVAGYLKKEATHDNDLLESVEQSMVPHLDKIDYWRNKLPSGYKIVNIYCESDSGLDECELLTEALNPMYHNGYNPARRDKYQMNEAVKNYGLRTVRQAMCHTKEEALAFAQNELGVVSQSDLEVIDDAKETDEKEQSIIKKKGQNYDGKQSNESCINNGKLGRATNIPQTHRSSQAYCVVKPKRGVASDDVFLCHSLEEVEHAFDKIYNTFVFGSINGESNDAVLVQEFAAGTEYALDIVSKNGEHKVAALWRYDKRPANGSSFVYFATEIVDATSDVGKQVCEYAMKALDALGVRHGLTHTEIIVNEEHGPRLVEVNCRQHNTNFAPLTMASIGYNAFDMLLAAYLGDLSNLPPETAHMRMEWEGIPSLPMTHAFSAVVHLVSFVEGTLIGIREDILDEIQNLPSVQYVEIYDHFVVGRRIEKTYDIRSDCGWVHLINDNEDQFQRDYNRIVDLMPDIFQVE
jgi:hypothetical protein